MSNLWELSCRFKVLQTPCKKSRNRKTRQHMQLLRKKIAEPERTEETHKVCARDVEKFSMQILREELQATAKLNRPRSSDAHVARSLRLHLLYKNFVSLNFPLNCFFLLHNVMNQILFQP